MDDELALKYKLPEGYDPNSSNKKRKGGGDEPEGSNKSPPRAQLRHLPRQVEEGSQRKKVAMARKEDEEKAGSGARERAARARTHRPQSHRSFRLTLRRCSDLNKIGGTGIGAFSGPLTSSFPIRYRSYYNMLSTVAGRIDLKKALIRTATSTTCNGGCLHQQRWMI